jgi:hypothetical protein
MNDCEVVMDIVPQRPLTIAEIDAAYLQLCGIAPTFKQQFALARELLQGGAYIDDVRKVHFAQGAIYDLARDTCSCGHEGAGLCLHQVAMRLRRLAIGRVLLREVNG